MSSALCTSHIQVRKKRCTLKDGKMYDKKEKNEKITSYVKQQYCLN